jgi:LmbE family N-acetylglucosaminyl deacetylase
MKYQTILVLAPHTDDAELGCGGLIARWVEEAANVFVAAFSTAEDSVPEGAPPDTLKNEFFRAMSILEVPEEHLTVYQYPVRRFSYYRQEVLEHLVKLRRSIQPDLVLLPSGYDLHQDHQVLHQEGLRAFKDTSVLGYELPWNNISFPAQAFVPLESRFLMRKWEALQAYESQIKLQRPYFTQEFINGWAKMRGTQIKTTWAEAFEVLRVVL